MTDKVAISMQDVNIVFGNKPETALPMMDTGQDRESIKEACGQILGVHNCSADVKTGEILVLMGLSGSGKSTLLRAVNGLNPVIRGKVDVMTTGSDGKHHNISVADANTADLSTLRTKLTAMVFQQFGLLPWRTVAENVALGLELSGMNKQQRLEKAHHQLKLVRLDDWANCLPAELSGGMQQRVGLARAFATDAPILLMDEPFSALDPLIRGHLQDELLVLQKELKRTIIFVSHDLDEAVRLGDRIAVMEGGRIIQSGSCEDIIINPKTDYVREFVSNLNPLSVLRAGLVMRDVKGDVALPAGIEDVSVMDKNVYVSADTPLRDVVEAVCDFGDIAKLNLYVHNDGKVVGEIIITDILSALIKYKN